MGRHWRWLPLVALAGCGVATVSVSQLSEEERTSQVEHGLGARIREQFGETARVNHVVDEKAGVLVGVALEGAPIDGDELPPVAFALYRPDEDKLTVLAQEAKFKEARLWGDKPAMVTTDGELSIAGAVIAQNVKGDLAVSPDGARMLVTLVAPDQAEETSIALVDAQGNLKPLGDGAGVDDRPTISPDGKTVVFVSGRSGISSFYRTTIDGEAPVQLTNANVAITEEASPQTEVLDEQDPEGVEDPAPADFVPPPVHAERMWWVDSDTLRYDAGGGELWRLNIRTGAASREVQ